MARLARPNRPCRDWRDMHGNLMKFYGEHLVGEVSELRGDGPTHLWTNAYWGLDTECSWISKQHDSCLLETIECEKLTPSASPLVTYHG